MAVLLLAAGLVSPGLSAAGENLLENAGFEVLAPDGIPSGWQRDYSEKMSGPLAVSSDAHEGKRCVCLMTEEWLLDRPQFVVQDVKLPRGTQALRLAAWCKGQGLMRLCIQFRKEGKPLETETLKQYFGEYVLPKETEHVYGLAPEYREYAVHAEVPAAADGVRVRLGNTIGRPNLANAWGYRVDRQCFAYGRGRGTTSGYRAHAPFLRTDQGASRLS